MCLFCFLPNYLQKNSQKKWLDFKYKHQQEITESLKDEINQCKKFIEILFEDARDLMLQRQFPLQLIQFQLHSNNYRNITVAKETVVNEVVQYLVQLSYPNGMAPLPLPGQSSQSGSVGKSIETVDEDLFIAFPDASFDPQGRILLNKPEYIESDILIEKIEYLLNDCAFEPVNNPETIIAGYSKNFSINCNDGSKVFCKEIKLAIPQTYENFKFYVIIGTHCIKCNKNPFIIFKQKGSKVPENLKEVFGKEI
jgi:hypothetical protein